MMMSGQQMLRKPVTKNIVRLMDIVRQTKLAPGKEFRIVTIIVPVLSENGFMFETEDGKVLNPQISIQDTYEYTEGETTYRIYKKFPRLNSGLIPSESQIRSNYHVESVEYNSTINEKKLYNFYVSGRS